MPDLNNAQIDPIEVVRLVEELANNTPPEVMKKMKRMIEEERRLQSPTNLEQVMTRRAG